MGSKTVQNMYKMATDYTDYADFRERNGKRAWAVERSIQILARIYRDAVGSGKRSGSRTKEEQTA